MGLTIHWSAEQRLEALDKANDYRHNRSLIRAGLKDRTIEIGEVLADPPDCISSMQVFDLILCVPRWGTEKTRKMLTHLHISTARPVGMLTVRERRELAGLLR